MRRQAINLLKGQVTVSKPRGWIEAREDLRQEPARYVISGEVSVVKVITVQNTTEESAQT